MTPLDNDAKERLTTAKKFQFMGYALIAGTAIALHSIEKISIAFRNFGSSDYILSFSHIILIANVVALIFLWITSTGHEFQLLQDNLSYAPIVESQAYLAMIVLSIILGALAYFYDNIIIFSSIFAIYNILNMWSVWIFNRHIAESFRISRSNPAIGEINKKAIYILEEYYLIRPHIPRIVTIMFFSMTSVILGTVGYMAKSPYAIYFIYCAYAVMIIDITLSEAVIFFWRYKRDNKLKNLHADPIQYQNHH